MREKIKAAPTVVYPESDGKPMAETEYLECHPLFRPKFRKVKVGERRTFTRPWFPLQTVRAPFNAHGTF